MIAKSGSVIKNYISFPVSFAKNKSVNKNCNSYFVLVAKSENVNKNYIHLIYGKMNINISKKAQNDFIEGQTLDLLTKGQQNNGDRAEVLCLGFGSLGLK